MTEKSALPEATERSLQILKKQIPAWGEYLLAQRGLSMRTVVSYRQDLENFFLFLDELYKPVGTHMALGALKIRSNGAFMNITANRTFPLFHNNNLPVIIYEKISL